MMKKLWLKKPRKGGRVKAFKHTRGDQGYVLGFGNNYV